MRALLIAIIAGLVAIPVAAQAQDPRTDTLIARADAGDAAARQELAPVARDLIQLASGRNVDAATARQAAEAALALAGPISPPEAHETTREREWRAPAVRALRTALARDSGDVWSAGHLEAIAPYPYIWLSPDKELRQLRALGARRGDLPRDLAVTRIRLEIERGSLDSASALLVRLPGNAVDTAIRDYVTAELDFARHDDPAGRAAYYRGAGAIDDARDADWYQRDLLWIAQPDELKQWQGLTPGNYATWLDAFWTRRDMTDVRMPGTRLPEQFRRWRIALHDYRWEIDGRTAEGLPTGDLQQSMIAPGDDFPMDESSTLAYLGAPEPGSRIIDDRGRLVLRHGEPTARANNPGILGLDMDMLGWATPNGALLVSFSRPMNCVNRTDCVSLTEYGMVARARPMGDLMSLCNLDSRLCVLAGLASIPPGRGGGRAASSNLARLIAQDYGEMYRTAQTTESNAETYRANLDAITEAYGIPQGGVLVVYAVPVKKLVTSGGVRDTLHSYTARIRILVNDPTTGRILSAVDTVRTFHVAKPLDSDNYLTAYQVVTAPTGTWQVAVVISDTLHRLATGERISPVAVVPFDGHQFQLGDPILGRVSSGLEWQRRGAGVPLNPTNAWRKDEPATLTYEIDGMVPGRAYQTRIEMWETAGSPRSPKNVTTFSEPATASFQVAQRELSLRELGPGNYRLVLRVRDTVTGQEVVRERRLAVRK